MSEIKDAARSEESNIARAVGVLSSATMLSRILGLLRDVITAGLFGAGGAMDAFFVAFRLPNMLRSLFAEGSLSASFVPVYSEVLEKEGEEASHRFGRICFTLLTLVLVVVVLLGVLLAPWFIKVLAMGFARDPEKFDLTVKLARMVFPYIGLVSLTALAGGILNARGTFIYPALAPVFLNVFIILSALALSPFMETPVLSLAYGVILGGVSQFLLQLKPLGRTGFSYSPSFEFRDPALKRMLLILGPSVFGVAVYQLNLVISTFLASWLREGAVSFLYYAERLFQLPLGVFAVSVGVASLPSLSRLAAREDWPAYHRTVRHSARLLWFVVLPASLGLIALAEPIVALLFQRGRFTPSMSVDVSAALRFYALAMVPVATTRVLAQAFYALKDTKTPVKAAAISLIVNFAASLLFAFALGLEHGGLALATAVSSGVNAWWLAVKFKAKTGENPFESLLGPLSRMMVASLLMAALVIAAALCLPVWHDSGVGTMVRSFMVLPLVVFGAVSYAFATKALRLPDLGELFRRLRGREV
ncbi:MAG: murein biosynthesis integral membrane protein MurJ [Deltaproteobacteria bacterium]|nr:MAG: murein biosynthesis integral membrane protein MurJ [Deltaproteobacteria bacterium]